MNYREKLKELRLSMNLSLRDFSKLVDISHTTISRLENGGDSKGIAKESIQLELLKQICDKTNYDFKLFLEETGFLDKSEKNIILQSEIDQLFTSLTHQEQIQAKAYMERMIEIRQEADNLKKNKKIDRGT